MSEATVDITELKETLKTRNQRCAIKEGIPILTSNQSDPNVLYVAPENFVIYLLKANKHIDSKTLEIKDKPAETIKNVAMTEEATITSLPPPPTIAPPPKKAPKVEKPKPKAKKHK